MRIQFTSLNEFKELQNKSLRDEAESWEDEGVVELGSAVMIPDDGSGTMEGFYRPDAGVGMVGWSDCSDASEWIEANSLREVFETYCADFE